MDVHANIAVIAACQQGDARAFREVFDLYKDRVYALCRHMAGNAEDAEDLAQETFVAVFQNIGTYRAEAAFGTWLYRIAANRCLNRLRQRRPEEARENFPVTAPDPSPEEVVMRKELNGHLEAAVAGLPESLRLVFVLGTLEGLRYKEIADVCQCSEDAVKMRVHRARKQVRDTMKSYLET